MKCIDFKTLFVATVLLLEGLVASAAPANSLSRDLLEKHPEQYDRAVAAMRTELSGSIPKKFWVDGVEYTGNYLKSGSRTDVYRIYENGQWFALRIPQQSKNLKQMKEYDHIMGEMNRRGIPGVKVISPMSARTVSSKVEFLPHFQTMEEILKNAIFHPDDPQVNRQLDAFVDFLKKYGGLKIYDIHSENIGVFESNGKYHLKIVDAGSLGKKFDFTPVQSYDEAIVSNVFDSFRYPYYFPSKKSNLSNADRKSIAKKIDDLEKNILMRSDSPFLNRKTITLPGSAAADVAKSDSCGSLFGKFLKGMLRKK